MPTYEYECSGCGARVEEFQQITDKPLRKCPQCGALKLRRLIGAGAGILFKGSGFYITDYRSKEYKEKAKAEKGQAEGTGDKKPGQDSSKGKKNTGENS